MEYSGGYISKQKTLNYFEETFRNITIGSNCQIALDANADRPKNALFVSLSYWGQNTGAFSVGMACSADGTTNLYLCGEANATIDVLRTRTWYYEEK